MFSSYIIKESCFFGACFLHGFLFIQIFKAYLSHLYKCVYFCMCCLIGPNDCTLYISAIRVCIFLYLITCVRTSSAFIMFGTVELLFSFNPLVFEEVICTHVFILMQRDTL